MKQPRKTADTIDRMIAEQKEGKSVPLLPDFKARDAKGVYIPVYRPGRKG